MVSNDGENLTILIFLRMEEKNKIIGTYPDDDERLSLVVNYFSSSKS